MDATALTEPFKEAAEENTQKRNKLDRQFEISEELKALFSERDKLTDDGKYEECRERTKTIRKKL